MFTHTYAALRRRLTDLEFDGSVPQDAIDEARRILDDSQENWLKPPTMTVELDTIKLDFNGRIIVLGAGYLDYGDDEDESDEDCE